MSRRESSPLLLRRQYVFPVDSQSLPHSPLATNFSGPVVNNFANELVIGGYMVSSQILGTGSFSEVRLGYCLQTAQPVAVKCIARNKISAESWLRLEKETQILKKVRGHPNIVQLYDVIVTPATIYQIFEYVHGADLLDFLNKFERIPEVTLRDIFRQLLGAVEHCHRQNIVHLDIKLENVMLEHETGRVVLIDFGFAEEVYPGSPYLSKKCGSPHYCAPEIVTSALYDPKVAEVWSLGVLLYILSTGSFPFDDDAMEPGQERVLVILHKIKTEELSFPDFPTLSFDLCCLIHSMLRWRPTERASLSALSSHPWFTTESMYY